MVFIYSDIASVAKLLHSAISFLPIKENQIFDFFFLKFPLAAITVGKNWSSHPTKDQIIRPSSFFFYFIPCFFLCSFHLIIFLHVLANIEL